MDLHEHSLHEDILAEVETYLAETEKFDGRGIKASAARARKALGNLGLKIQNGLGSQGFKTETINYVRPEDNILQTVFKDGKILKTYDFAEIRALADKGLKKSMEKKPTYMYD